MSFISNLFNSAPAPQSVPAPIAAAPVIAAQTPKVPDAFTAALALTLSEEGGFGDDARDKGNWTGGECGVGQCLGTNFGVASSSYADILRNLPSDVRSGMPWTVKDLTRDQAGTIYRYRYWNTTRCDELPPPVALVCFDSAVNSGVGRAIQWLQGAVGAHVDGGFGPATLAAVTATVKSKGGVALASAVLDERLAFLRSLATFPIYGKGWTRRVSDLRARITTFPA